MSFNDLFNQTDFKISLKWLKPQKYGSNLIDKLIYFKLKIVSNLKGSSIYKQHLIVFFIDALVQIYCECLLSVC
jgi:hypothetical protein